MAPAEVFLSHASADARFVRSLADALQRHGVRVWYSATHIRGATQWHDEIGAALTRCDWFAVILSPKSVKSMWVKRELLYALQEERFANRIIPILHKRCNVQSFSWALSAIQFVDFTQSFDDGLNSLLRVWHIRLHKS